MGSWTNSNHSIQPSISQSPFLDQLTDNFLACSRLQDSGEKSFSKKVLLVLICPHCTGESLATNFLESLALQKCYTTATISEMRESVAA